MNVNDIYEYAKVFDADYMDLNSGYTFKVQQYNEAIRNGWPTKGIEVYDYQGEYVGFVREHDEA